LLSKGERRREADQQDCKDTEGNLLVHDALIDVGGQLAPAGYKD
jgi:hypothetical protein